MTEAGGCYSDLRKEKAPPLEECRAMRITQGVLQASRHESERQQHKEPIAGGSIRRDSTASQL